MSDLSVVIPSRHRSDLLRPCLASVLRHAPSRTEVIVVDDGSDDAIVSRTAKAYRVHVLRLPRPGGFCRAANAGVAAARGTVVELLNDDTETTPGWASSVLAHFRNPAVGAVAPLVLYPPQGRALPPLIDSAGDRYDVGGIAGKRWHGERLTSRHLVAGPVFGVSASSAFYRREALVRTGGFPEEFGAYFEDVDLSFRLRRAGYAILYEPGSRIHHHVSASHGRADRRLREQQSRNEERVFWRNLPAPLLARAMPRHLLVLLAKAGRRWVDGGFMPFALGRLRLLAEVRDLLRHRRYLRDVFPAPRIEHWLLDWPGGPKTLDFIGSRGGAERRSQAA